MMNNVQCWCFTDNGGVLKARIVRNMDGLDLTMYHKAVDLFNNYFTRDTELEQAAS